MADPLSMAASLITVVQISGQVISFCYDYRQGLKNASKDLLRVTAEVTSLRNVLESLVVLVDDEKNIDNNFLPMLTDVLLTNGLLDVCLRDLRSPREKIEKPVSEWKALGRRLIWPLHEKEITRTLESVHRTRSVLETALMVDNTASMIEIRDTTRNLMQGLFDFTSAITLAPETKLKIVVDWLNGPDPSIKHKAEREARAYQTGKWFLHRKDYKDWQTQANSGLWLHGIPGCGKSVLCSSIIEDIIALLRREHHSVVLYYYFDFANKVANSAESLLRSLVTQMAKQSPELPKALVRTLTEKSDGTYWGAESVPQPSLTELSDILHDSIGGFDHFYVILDALDECVETHKILSLLKQFVESRTGKVHVLVTSRYEVDIEEQLLSIITGQIQIESHLIEPDIRSHIQQQLQTNPRLKKWPPKVKERMEFALVTGSQGMFRWAACQLDVLSRCKVFKQLEVTLKTLPKDLAETYQRALQNLDAESYDLAYKLLSWLTVAPRPVRLEEAVEFLAVDQGNGEELIFDPDMRLFDANDILTMCTGLVSVSHVFIKSKEQGAIVHQVQEIRLAHSSVKDFLLLHFQNQTLPPVFGNIDSQAYVAECCLAYLLHFPGPLQPGNDIKRYPLARYAAERWMRHMQHSQSKISSLGTRLMLELMDESNPAFLNWIRLYNADKPWRGVDASVADHASALYYASQSGFEYLVDQLLSAGSKPDYGQGMFGTPLQVAAYNGHLQVAKKLLSAGACPNTEGGIFKTPLKAAAAIGHIDITRLLIKHGANPDVSEFSSGTALFEATKNRHPNVTRVLIEEGQADVNIFVSRKVAAVYGGNPLEIASRRCDMEIVSQILPKASKSIIATGMQAAAQTKSRELLELYVSYDPNGVLHYAAEIGWADLVTNLLQKDAATATLLDDGFIEGSSLVVAAAGGYESIVQELISNKADVNAASDRRYTLESAAEKGFSSIITMLLEHGADVNACGKEGTALQKASHHGNINIVNQLLDHGADIRFVDGSYGGPLQAAAIGGHCEVAKLLLNRGADVNEQPAYWRHTWRMPQCSTPLTAATYRGDIEMFDLLLNKGARTDLQGEDRPPALHVSVKKNHAAIMAKLLAAGADIEIEHQGNTPLSEAISAGNFAAAQELLKAGANPNYNILQYDDLHETLLYQAIAENQGELLKLLLDFGADVNALSDVRKSSKEPPLHTATEKGSMVMVQILLEYGADYNWQDDTGWTVSHLASRCHPEILRLLCDDYGADLSLNLSNGSLPLHSAGSGGNVACIEILLAHGVDINTRNNHGRTPLHFAVEKANLPAVKLFLERGARLDIQEEETQMTALDYAKMELIKEPDNSDRQIIVEILEEETM